MQRALCFVFSCSVLAGGMLAVSEARAQDAAPQALPPLPPEEDAPPPRSAPVASDTSVVNAGTVRTNRVDTVVVAEPGSNVSIHGHDHEREKDKEKYAPDPGRKAAMIASPIVFGVGAAAAGIAYLSARNTTTCTSAVTPNSSGAFTEQCTHDNAVPPLVLYDVIVGAVPSVPRWVVGDVGGALLYTGLRGGSLLVASVVNWGTDNNNWIGPFTLGFLAPITLAIVDLATTPHREDLQPQKPAPVDAKLFRPQITGISPVALTDAEHRVNGGVLTLSASF